MEFAWNAGRAGTVFLEHLSRRQIVGSRCGRCRRVSVPPKSFCPECLGRTEIPVPLSPTGVIETATHHTSTATTFALIRLDGADTSLLHYYLGDTPPTPGTRVRAVWAETPDLSIHALRGFEAEA